MNLKSNIKNVFADKNTLCIFIMSIILVGFHTWQYIQLPTYAGLLRVIMYSVFSLTIMLFGKGGLFFDLIAFSLIAAHFNSFINFTSFFVMLLSCRIYRKSEKFLLCLYVLNESVALMIQDKGISHLVIHFITCAFFYSIYFYINRPKLLELTDDERAILEEMKAGKLQKEITLFSKNIVSKKLQDAKDRNHINTTVELLAKFVIE